MAATIPTPLFVLEMANNHMGDVEHGLAVIRSFGKVCREFPFNFAFKLQYRDLDSFIHPAARGRDDIKYVKRFSETRLERGDFDRLVAEMRANGFLAMATPFDEPSVDLIESQGLDFIKIASCSFTDWPLLERIVLTDKPIIASTAGARLEEIDRVVSFFAHRHKHFAIMHCVGEYPTPDERMHLSQVDFLRERYPRVRIGFSTHENPGNTDIVKMAVAKGVTLFEKHVGLSTKKYPLNAYSASPEQIRAWLEAAQKAWTICGTGDSRLPSNPQETASLRSLQRGIFAKRPLAAGEKIDNEDIYFAFPPQPDQFTANDWFKYAEFTATTDIVQDAPVAPANAGFIDQRAHIWDIAKQVKKLLSKTKIVVPGGADLEVSHHYGLDRFDEVGLVIITVVNRGYCKKLLVSLPGQMHPEQYHKKKEETFHVIHGEIMLELDGEPMLCRSGDVVTIEPGVRHKFKTETGAVIEEISTTHDRNDSFYTDPAIMANKQRKTLLTYWMD
ncbi:MAG: N-acetylneuraminate synthase family protein [Gammaproteobacteria bacterium]|nr:N-acetylneuraminate synthase family protein [Gammaproteobacteria bacterium]MBU1775831.1 N-acetylneuraminate synthase family protein [Gammaproteobacteria bacterium]MBU1968449.1 N-acetylneuraminate synthase family protein [Gammaproteobacteria bacterium]